MGVCPIAIPLQGFVAVVVYQKLCTFAPAATKHTVMKLHFEKLLGDMINRILQERSIPHVRAQGVLQTAKYATSRGKC
jgi:hypothetical protein